MRCPIARPALWLPCERFGNAGWGQDSIPTQEGGVLLDMTGHMDVGVQSFFEQRIRQSLNE